MTEYDRLYSVVGSVIGSAAFCGAVSGLMKNGVASMASGIIAKTLFYTPFTFAGLIGAGALTRLKGDDNYAMSSLATSVIVPGIIFGISQSRQPSFGTFVCNFVVINTGLAMALNYNKHGATYSSRW